MTIRRFESKLPLLVITFAFVKPPFCSSEPQDPRPVLLDSERREIERKQLQETFSRSLEEWDRTLRHMNRPPPPGASTVDVEELRIPKKARNQRNAAWLELRKNKLDSAEKKATKAIAIYSQDPNAYLIRGEVRLKSGRAEAAQADFEEAISIKPDSVWMERAIAAAYLRNKQPDMALLRIKSGIARTGENSASLCLKGEAEFTMKQFDQAELSFRRSLSLDPGNHLAVFYLARICFKAGRYDESIGLLRPLLSEPDLKVDRLQIVALIDHAARLLSMRTRTPAP